MSFDFGRIEFGFDADRKILLTRVTGVLDEPLLLECHRQMKRAAAATAPQSSICDLRAVVDFPLSAQFLHHLAKQVPPLDPQCPSFIVVPNQLAYGLARMFQIESEHTKPETTVVLPHDREFAAFHSRSRFLRVRQNSHGLFAIDPSAQPLVFPNPAADGSSKPLEPLPRPDHKTFPPTHHDRRAQQLLGKIARRPRISYVPQVGDTVLVSGMAGAQRVLCVDDQKQEVDVQALSGHVRFRRAVPWSLLSRSGEKRKAKKAAE
jgi:hypothetical protein